MASKWFNRLINKRNSHQSNSYLRNIVTGSLYKLSDLHGDTSIADIHTQIDTMRALARDSQISTALSYYATDATTVNTNGDVIWATPANSKFIDGAEIVNALLKRWKVNTYARDHILELATIGNLYIPTTQLYADMSQTSARQNVALDYNTIEDLDFDIVPAYKIPPEDVVHLWHQGEPHGYLYQVEDYGSNVITYPECAIIHFSLGGLLGQYTIDTVDSNNQTLTYDIQFAQPLMDRAVQPTQTLSLLEDSMLLSSLIRVVKFINVDCGQGGEESEIASSLQQIKDAIEQQLSINTTDGDIQSFVNPNSPNNLIYLPKINGNDAISITDLNMSEATETDNKLLEYYQDKKLSVLGVPKEAMNFSSNEGLGGAGSVLSQRSALYANSLQRLETAYISGWTDAINTYFTVRGMSGFVDSFKLHMNPIITTQSTIQFDKRDSALSQATALVDILKSLNVSDKSNYQNALKEILSEVFPQMGADSASWSIDPASTSEGGIGNEI